MTFLVFEGSSGFALTRGFFLDLNLLCVRLQTPTPNATCLGNSALTDAQVLVYFTPYRRLSADMKINVAIAACTIAFITSHAACAADPLWVRLGPTNVSHGLIVPSGGDGTNTAETIAGSPCRRISGPKSSYLYVKTDEGLISAGCHDVYLAVEFFDDRLGMTRVQYDKTPVDRSQNSFYTAADDVILGVDSRQWHKVVVHLPDARLGHSQNHGADLRLCGEGLAVRRIDILFSRPSDYCEGGVIPAQLESSRTRIGPGMELTFGNDTGVGQAALLRTLGVTSVESYVTWQTVEDKSEGQWDWSHWDQQVKVLEQTGLKWVPFLIAGPGYATPQWYRESDRSVPYICLEHGDASKIQSLWNPEWRPWIDRFIRTFAERYRDRRVIESVLLGISGTYGEAIYPAGPAQDEWTYKIPGRFHNHRGWWAGDRFARTDFRRCLQKQYRDIAALNRAWTTQHTSFEAIAPFLAEKAPSLRARFDMAQWYLQSMTDWAAFWVSTTRKYLPDVPIYLCVGGAGEPDLGADFSAQAQALVASKARIRITNEGSNYAQNFVITREVATAARAFGLDFGFEPASHVSADGNVARIYNATASGAIQLHCYHGNILPDPTSIARFRQYAAFLQRRSPQIHAAVYLPKASWALDAHSRERGYRIAQALRDRVDFEFLDRATLTTPLATNVKVLAVPCAPYADADEIAAMERWVTAGGILVVQDEGDRPLLRTPDGDDRPGQALLARTTADVRLFSPSVTGPPVRHFRLEIGGNHDSDYLGGQWHTPEHRTPPDSRSGATWRWTGAKAKIDVPCDPTSDATLILAGDLTSASIPGNNEVFVGGKRVGTIDQAGSRSHRFTVSKSVLAGSRVAEVVISVRTFRPSERNPRHDNRELGMMVWSVEMIAAGAEGEPPVVAPINLEVDWAKLAPCIRRIGKGATLAVPCRTDTDFPALVSQTLQHLDRIIPGTPAIELPSPDRDGVYATQCTDGVLYLNTNDTPKTISGLVIPAHGIGHGPTGGPSQKSL